MLDLSPSASRLAGILLLSYLAVTTGGWYLTRVASGRVVLTEFQKSFARAGHGHAAVLLMLGLIGAVLTDATTLDGVWASVARSGIPVAALLMSAGFFFSSMGRGRTQPNRWFFLVWLGFAALAAGVTTLGIGLLSV